MADNDNDDAGPSETEKGREGADIARASNAGEKDGAENDYEPNSEDTTAQKAAYDKSWKAGYDKNH